MAFLTNSQVMSLLPVWGPHFEEQGITVAETMVSHLVKCHRGSYPEDVKKKYDANHKSQERGSKYCEGFRNGKHPTVNKGRFMEEVAGKVSF